MAYTTIKKSSDYFNTKLYTGNASSSRDITGVGFQPDFTWIKDRDGTFSHILGNAVSGDNKFLSSNGTAAESTDSTKFRTFVSDGFQVGNHNGVNANSNDYASWNWLGANGTAANTDGSISSTVSASATSGFSIVSYTGTGANATVGHGLGVAPSMIIIKNRDSALNWLVYHQAMGNTSAMKLNATSAKETTVYYWNNTSPTSSTFSLGASSEGNTASGNIAYCFADVQGYSKFGSYTGNGSSSSGPFIYTGFKPAFVMTKRTDVADWWVINDTKRDIFNASTLGLRPNDSAAESSDDAWTKDILSNGFKQRTANGGSNASGGTYIYMAFASEPLVGDNPATAR